MIFTKAAWHVPLFTYGSMPMGLIIKCTGVKLHSRELTVRYSKSNVVPSNDLANAEACCCMSFRGLMLSIHSVTYCSKPGSHGTTNACCSLDAASAAFSTSFCCCCCACSSSRCLSACFSSLSFCERFLLTNHTTPHTRDDTTFTCCW